ncbi:hypothetical protein HOBO_30 [Bacillus phage Hobo]|uniref:Uncharacterized protein n=2 Tax=Caeruleovirus BM15 TaxID=1985178 RepID=A0A0S2MUC4_9CAUD|nr:hypothetical protein FD732_gp030 [Bacillus phage BM15]ALO79451.1 hypothetical protein BM10_30 [Bacillus phage BM15]AXQ66811.1 hypothetical protein HOBO_30 [Bacillus phage Hobo]
MKDVKETIKMDTHWAKQYYKNRKNELDNYENDPYKEGRVRSQECKTCFYLRNGLAMQAFTEYECKHCKKERMHHNSRTPKYCPDCSTELEICQKCGAEMD